MPRGKHNEEKMPGIVVLYTSLMILLLAFFIMLNSLSKVEEARVEAAYQSLAGTFGFTPGGTAAFQTEEGKNTGATVPLNPVNEAYTSIRGLASQAGLDDQVSLTRSGSQRSISMTAAMLFEPGSLELNSKAKAFLDQVAQVVGDKQFPLTLLGHTDSTEIKGPGGLDNWDVSARRALAVVRYLATKGVKPERMSAYGLAGYRPQYDENSLANRRRNNRVEIVLNTDDAGTDRMVEGQAPPRLDFRGFEFNLLDDVKEK
ncbi:MAG: flagellar motor protein MotB [Deltaproteobacteria bacterium]|nr:flagellar motor protein MotB [Deltaproteobacteria bacterium]